MKEKLAQYSLLMRLDKPVGIFLLLWPTLWAVWIASEGKPDLLVLFVFIAGVVLMRSAGCVINDFADRKIDGKVERTANRPLATGKISSKEALTLFVVLCLTAFGLVLFMNSLTIKLSFAALVLAAIYPFMKRYTHLPQLFLGLAFGWAIPMAFAAVQNVIPPVAWWLFAATVTWAVIYDTMYAMVDREDDLTIGVKSTAILFGEHDRLVIGILQFVMVFLLLMAGRLVFSVDISWPFHVALLIAAVIMMQHRVMIRERDPAKCFLAFKQNHWIGLVILLGIIVTYL